MNINIRNDSVEISGYVNAVERNSRPLTSRIGKFIERICKGAFSNALKRSDDVHILLNHRWDRDLGSVKQGNLELHEDNIGLHARATVTDTDIVEKARNGELVGWSFGFKDVDVDEGTQDNLLLRMVKELDLVEVSILDRTRTPAYDGTLVMVRAEDDICYYGDDMITDVNVREETVTEHREDVKNIDYSEYEEILKTIKEEKK